MVVKVKETQGYFFQDIGFGEVFYGADAPRLFLLRTDRPDWVAVDLETGALYHSEDFNHDTPWYHIVKAEVNIPE